MDTKLWDRLVGAKNESYSHYNATSKEILEWRKFIAISQHELSSSRACDAKPILDAITSLKRFYLVLGRLNLAPQRQSESSRCSVRRGLRRQRRRRPQGCNSATVQALAVRAAPAAGGKEGE